MCAFNAALDFGKDMIELSASTLGQLIGIQLADLTTFLEHQSAAISRVTEVHDVAALLALQREYREAFWKDRRAALTAAKDALQVASQVAAKSWNEWVGEGTSATLPEKTPATKRVKRKPAAIEKAQVAPVTAAVNASMRTKTQRTGAKIGAVGSEAEHDAKQDAPRPLVKKRNVRSRKGTAGTRSPPTATR